MTRRATVRQADFTRAIRGALKAGLPVGSFKVVVENDQVAILPVAANEPSDAAADAEQRMKDAFGR